MVPCADAPQPWTPGPRPWTIVPGPWSPEPGARVPDQASPVWWPSGTRRAESSREPACPSPWGGGAPTPAPGRRRPGRRTCCRDSLRGEEPARQLPHPSYFIQRSALSKLCPLKQTTSSGLLFTGDGQVPQRNVVQLFGQTGHPVRVGSVQEWFSVLHVRQCYPIFTTAVSVFDIKTFVYRI